MQTHPEFSKHVREALNHLYNVEQLRNSPLIEMFGLSTRYDAPSALQNILIEAIHALRPAQSEPLQSQNRKTYEILLLRYIQQFRQPEVAHNLGVSERQLRREQTLAICALAESLWKKTASARPVPRAEVANTDSPSRPVLDKGAESDTSWDWIKNAHSERVSHTAQFFDDVYRLIQPVAVQYQVELVFPPRCVIPDLAVHPVALRQILLNLLRVAIAHASGGKVHLGVNIQSSVLIFGIETQLPAQETAELLFGQEENLLAIAARLVDLSNGRIEIDVSTACKFCASLTLPLVKGISVLVVDDNNDIIDLLQRYTSSTRYSLTGLKDTDQIFQEIANVSPSVIILDVMMPKVDGWELLGRLRRNPRTANIPVIILSILAQEELALSLGARAFMVKPVTQERFLEALDHVYSTLN